MSFRLRSMFGLTLLAVVSVATAAILATPYAVSAPGGGGQRCGGFAGLDCPGSLICVDDPTDNCKPSTGDTDCIGVCRPPHGPPQQASTSIQAREDFTPELWAAGKDEGFDFGDESASCETTEPEVEAMAGGPGRGCKPCKKDRRWCACTYNGLPRASCDPCCYTNDIGILVCLD